jgi:hypothetical protein
MTSRREVQDNGSANAIADFRGVSNYSQTHVVGTKFVREQVSARGHFLPKSDW